ncbi:hypothetical protein BDB00DRAFT_880050 [Zychaea mexicana]|uniref:uncharacterized protein n=1 Tax=Zychaea mexicana TaxID=64656 RepID=UPI0022FDE692|nr:uncharacterized protein BDB00DRAFT_880050 [Zychaea mexicana]KAI9471395.1 hypothetical protein BDB00DRAFT_880050 [Zychaea mexicana]
MTVGEKPFAGKVAVITGASRNIGKAIATELVNKGAKVIIGDILDSEGDVTVRELNDLAGDQVAAYIHTDVTKYSNNAALFQLAEKQFGGVDIAIFNAGIGSNANTMFMPLDDEMDERMMAVNTTAVIKGNKVAMLHLAKRNGGVIINMASAAGLRGTPAVGIYCASKFGVVGWVRSCGIYNAVCNVRVNAVCPTFVETELADALGNAGDQDPFATLVEKSPKAKVETVIETVLKFIQEEERNAQTLVVLPDGVISDYDQPNPFPESLSKNYPEYLASVQTYSKEAIAYYRKRLAEARERYGI